MAPLDRDRWRALQPLLDRALDLTGDERDAWLRTLHAEFPSLAAELTAILAGETGADRVGLLVAPLAAPFRGVPDASLAGMELGGYTLERPLGHGGMGTVWLARRSDGRYEGQAAVKLLNLALLSPVGQERFRREGSALARLAHPGIARLLDAGVSGAGQPYLVLELVDGQRIDAYAAERALSHVERIRLVLQVLDAIGHAHANLVVHRDIKPSNVLVTAAGEVKLLDFGIAKLLDDDGGAGPPSLTAEGARALTPEFAAPEQVLGDPVTTGTDVYACGVLLYLLLSGRHPTADGCRTAAEAIRAVVEVEPARLGLGDLDAVVAKALRKAPRERYATVAALADDLSRWLRHEPVSARPDSLAYRTRTFVRRHRVAVTAAGAAAALLAGAGLRERALRAEAQTEARKAAAVGRYLESVFGAVDPYAGPNERPPGEATARSLLDRGAARADSALAAAPEVQAELRGVLGRVYANLGLYDQAAPVLRRALAQRRALYGAEGEPVAAVMDQLGEVLAKLERFDEAEPLLRESLARRRALHGSADSATAASLDHLASLLEQRDDLAGAEPLFREALAVRRAVYGEEHETVAMSMNNLGQLLYRRGREDDAEPLHRAALAIQTRRLGERHLSTAQTLHNLAVLEERRGRYPQADTLFRRALAIKRALLGDLHPSVTVNLNNLGGTLIRMGRPDEAAPLLREALALDRRMFGPRHSYVAESMRNLASALRMQGDFAGAEATMREALAIHRALLGPEHSRVALTLNDLGAIVHLKGDPAGAVSLFRESAAIYGRTHGARHTVVTTARLNMARALRDAGRAAEAESIFREYAARLDTAKASERVLYIGTQVGIGRTVTEWDRGRAGEVLPVLERALVLATAEFRPGDIRLAEARFALGECLAAVGQPARAAPLLREAHAGIERHRRASPLLAARVDAAFAAVARMGGGATR